MLKCVLVFVISIISLSVLAQDKKIDSSAVKEQVLDSDTLSDDDLEALFDDLEAFLDSLLNPRSYLLINVSMSRGYYNYKVDGTYRVRTVSANTYSPSVAYFHKSGLGLTAAAYITSDKNKLDLYQGAISPSYDYLSNRAFATGISYTRYFSKDSLKFYVSPLQQELNAYFTYRKSWIRPSVSINYAWGNRKELQRRLNFIQSLRLRRRLANFLQANQEVNDLSLTASLLHDFYWLKIFSARDHIRLTPQFIFTSGTQQYGFNQQTNNYLAGKISRQNLLATARQFNLDNKKEFKPLSLGFTLKAEYSIGKFYIQPQMLFDYYFPAEEDNLSSIFCLNAGLYF